MVHACHSKLFFFFFFFFLFSLVTSYFYLFIYFFTFFPSQCLLLGYDFFLFPEIPIIVIFRIPFLVHNKGSFIEPAVIDIYCFIPYLLLSSMGVLANHLLVVSGLATTTYLCWLCRSPLPDKECYFVCLLAMTFLPIIVCVLSLSLSPMECTWWFQLILTSFRWHVISAGHFPQKSLSKNPRIGFFPSPHRQTIPSLISDPWPTTSYIG